MVFIIGLAELFDTLPAGYACFLILTTACRTSVSTGSCQLPTT